MSKVYSYRKMQPEDLRRLMEGRRGNAYEDEIIDRFLDNGDPEHSFAFLRDGELFACEGMTVIWQGRAECWAVVSPDADRWDMLWLTRQSRETMVELAIRLKLRRIEATAIEYWKDANQWVRLMGFSPGRVLERYDPLGRDHRSWVWLT